MQTESATGSVSSNKVRTTLSVAVEAIDFDTQACVLRVKGRNVQENQYVKVNYLLRVFDQHSFETVCVRFQAPIITGFWVLFVASVASTLNLSSINNYC